MPITAKECRDAQTALGEANDCAIRAVAVAAQLPYRDVHKYFASLGRRPRHGVHTRAMIQGLLDLERVDWPSIGRTVRTFAAACDPSETYLVFTRGHVACVRLGVVEDWTAGRLHRIVTAYRVLL